MLYYVIVAKMIQKNANPDVTWAWKTQKKLKNENNFLKP